MSDGKRRAQVLLLAMLSLSFGLALWRLMAQPLPNAWLVGILGLSLGVSVTALGYLAFKR